MRQKTGKDDPPKKNRNAKHQEKPSDLATSLPAREDVSREKERRLGPKKKKHPSPNKKGDFPPCGNLMLDGLGKREQERVPSSTRILVKGTAPSKSSSGRKQRKKERARRRPSLMETNVTKKKTKTETPSRK